MNLLVFNYTLFDLSQKWNTFEYLFFAQPLIKLQKNICTANHQLEVMNTWDVCDKIETKIVLTFLLEFIQRSKKFLIKRKCKMVLK